MLLFFCYHSIWDSGGRGRGGGNGGGGGGCTIAQLVYRPTYDGGCSLNQITLFLSQREVYRNCGNWFILSTDPPTERQPSKVKARTSSLATFVSVFMTDQYSLLNKLCNTIYSTSLS